ncbi:glycoside hydrolase 43 family protein [Jeotgalibacillus sp. ET6]|uniref:glycoside hydrolase family 43 protein n=1 Tax=Jeotgalibacillus sp. ET6 TaxID=3037260 RepID=UPI002418B141|nr:glycoside hydrolase 43 family protein [Jeotgalibacillus sp. ET6]MDG5472395.1 glycoside hydrolase 43 family protein [Jeotgalibacillus sp. ET6]
MTSEQEPRFYENPIIWADVPDPDVIRVGEIYYMSSTTMHMNPGIPIMKSTDLLHWEIINYTYNVLDCQDEQKLLNGKNEYGKGSWASSLRYHKGIFYVAAGSLSTGKTYIFQTQNIEQGPWKCSVLNEYYHDMSLLFDDDDRVFMVYGTGDLKVIELTEDATAIKEGGLNKIIIKDASLAASAKEDVGLPAEGAHIHKRNGSYYIFTITWPKNGPRTQLVHRATSIDGVYEGRVAVKDPAGIAQGGIVDTPEGNWHGMLFHDYGPVGRTPCLIPVEWVDGWPVFGDNGRIPERLPVPLNAKNGISPIIQSDEFDSGTDALQLVWQWNHYPLHTNWSLLERPGFLRLTSGGISSNLEQAQNTLTQRTLGPACSGRIAIETAHMKDGDVAGLAAFQKDYGYAGVKAAGSTKSIVMVNASSGREEEIASVPVDQNRIYLKVEFDFQNAADKAYFFYSLDEEEWHPIGQPLPLTYKLEHFMGYRFALFHYATVISGGFVEFDYFRFESKKPS